MPRVAIIGAGAAGMLTAFELLDRGVEVVVYEACDRVGGRLLTVDLGGDIVDLGAESFEAGESSAWWRELGRRKAIPEGMELRAPFAEVDEELWWFPDGEDLQATKLRLVNGLPDGRRVEERLEGNARSADDIAVGRDVQLDTPAARVSYGTSGFGAFSESIEPRQYSAQDRARNESDAADARPFLDGRAYGIGTLFRDYGGRLREAGATIRLSAPPDRIEQRLLGWYLSTRDGPVEHFDAVVITVSVGALARQKFPLAKPIREAVQAAFAGIELGGYIKVGMRWPEAAAALGGRDAAVLGYFADPTSTQIWQVSKLPNSLVVVAATAGIHALALDRRDSLIPAHQAVRVVQLAADVEGEPERRVASTWASDRRFGGAYSYSRPGAGSVRAALAQTLVDRFRHGGLFFAGEALSVPYYGSLEATYHTGVAAAEACATFLRLD